MAFHVWRLQGDEVTIVQRTERLSERPIVLEARRAMKYGIRCGLRVGNIRWLDRWPNFQLEPGHTGTIVRADSDMIAIRMHVHMPGAAEWNNEFQLTPDDLTFEYEGGQTYDTLEDLFHFYFCGD